MGVSLLRQAGRELRWWCGEHTGEGDVGCAEEMAVGCEDEEAVFC